MCPAEYESCTVWAFMPFVLDTKGGLFLYPQPVVYFSVRSDSALNDIYIPPGRVH